MKLTNKKILLVSPEAWGVNFVSKHHYAYYLSKNNEVYFLNPVIGSRKNPFAKLNVNFEEVSPSLTVVSYLNLVPRLNNLGSKLRNKVYLKQAKQIQQVIGVKEFDIVWSFDPYRYPNQKVWKAKKYIYHSVDVHSKTGYETEIAKTSNLVLVSSELLIPDLKKANQNIHNLGHGADLDAFERPPIHIILPGEQKIKAGLVGNFNNNVDYDLISKIALTNPKIDFIFIGPYQNNNLGNDTDSILEKVSQLKKIENVYFIGSVPSNTIIHYLKLLDINLVLYKEDKRNIIINPHKMMAYFYAGNITISSYFNEYKNAEEKFIKMKLNNVDIPKALAEVADQINYWNSCELKEVRRSFAVNNSYERKLLRVEELLYENQSNITK